MQDPSVLDYQPRGRKLLPRRWMIGFLLAAAIAISYLDRSTLGIAREKIEHDIKIDEIAFGNLATMFLLAYAIMYMGGGKLIDALGTRIGFLVVMLFWSLACASHGLAQGFWFLAACRFALGLGEGGGFPAAIKAIAEWFPAKERSMALGVLNCGTALGSVIAPPVIAGILDSSLYASTGIANWRWVFFATGGVGLLWTVWWMWDYYGPNEHPRISPSERQAIEAAHHAAGEEPGVTGGTPWLELFTFKATWGLMISKLLSDAAWFFYSLWIPTYLQKVRHFNTKEIGYYAWIPFAFAGLGSLTGGAVTTYMMHRWKSANVGRKAGLAFAAMFMPWPVLVTWVDSQWAIVLMSIAFFGHQAWSASLQVLPTDLYPRRVIGSVAGLMGCAGALGGVILGQFAGRILDYAGLEKGYRIVFTISSTLHLLALAIVLLMIPRVRMLTLTKKPDPTRFPVTVTSVD